MAATPRKRVRRPNNGPLDRYHRVPGEDGRPHLYLNMAIPHMPRDEAGKPLVPVSRSVCLRVQGRHRCGHAYTHMLLGHAGPTGECEECHLEWLASKSVALQDELGIDLGWSAPEIDDRPDRVSRLEVAP